MKKKIAIISATIAAVLVTAVIAGSFMQTPEQTPFGVVISAQVLSIDVPQATKFADTIVTGRVSDIRRESWDDPDYPLVRIVTLDVETYLENPRDTKTIEIRDFGEGVFDDPIRGRSQVQVGGGKVEFNEGEKVLVFLDYDEGNVMGDGYYVVGASQGKYSIEEGMVKNQDPSRDMPLQEMLKIVSDAAAESN
jgi:hypothetical protein